jgi:hypothetical protein
MWKRTTKVSTIYIYKFNSWDINLLTFRTIDLKELKYMITLTLEMLRSSDMPTGSTSCLSQSTLGQVPKTPFKNLALMICKPLDDIINLE